MYSLICDGRVLAEVSSIKDAYAAASLLSTQGKGTQRKINGAWQEGRMVSVWSGPIGPSMPGSKYVRGVTKHVTYACGEVV